MLPRKQFGPRLPRARAAFLGALALAVACAPSPSPLLGRHERPPVIVLLLDALRPDAMGLYGSPRPATPCLDRLSRRGIVLTSAYAQAAYTVTSVSSLLTGLYPQRHRVEGVHDRLGPEATTLAELLRQAGYRTFGFTASPVVSPRYGLAQGFDRLVEVYEIPSVQARHVRKEKEIFYHVQAGDVTPLLSELLDGLSPGEPFFLYVHYLQPHTPYAPPPPYGGLFDPDYEGDLDGEVNTVSLINRGLLSPTPRDLAHLRALYDGNLASADHEVGRLLQELGRRGLLDPALLVVVSDHGEAFGEHAYCGHNFTVFEEMVRVPWIWKLPEGATAPAGPRPRHQRRPRRAGPARRSRPMRASALSALLSLLVLAAAAALPPDPVAFPSRSHPTPSRIGLPPCLFRATLGRPCPLCGMTTAATRMARGDWRGALAAHPIGALAPVAAAAGLLLGVRGLARRAGPLPPRALAALRRFRAPLAVAVVGIWVAHWLASF